MTPMTKSLTIEEKQDKIKLNYETIEVLKEKLNEAAARERTGMTRAAYIKMIFDVTKKVGNQNDELRKAKQDTRRLQRDIGLLSSRLERNFSVVETTILKDAKNDGWSGECYRLLNLMHDNCDLLVKSIQETGDVSREIRQIEDQIGQLRIVAAAAATTSINEQH